MTNETGPIYGVPLIKTLPIGDGGMLQAMPSYWDLVWCREASHERVAAGYEVLLAHYHQVCEERDKLRQQVRECVSDQEVRKMETGL